MDLCNMGCDAISRRLGRGEPLDAEERRHVEGCPACRSLAKGGLARTLAAAADASPEGIDFHFAGIEQALERERGVRAWLRSRPTGLRVALAVGIGATPLLVEVAVARAEGLSAVAIGRSLLVLAALGAVLVLAAWASLRPLQRRPLPAPVSWGISLSALVMPVVAAFLSPAAVDPHPTAAAVCFAVGALAALPVVVAFRLLDRTELRHPARLPLAAAGAGMAANLLLHAHCPIDHPVHLLAGHATVVLAYIGATIVVGRTAR
jgi:hypothetical protein